MDAVLYAIPGFLFFLLLELYLNRRLQRNYFEKKDSWTDIAMGLLNVTTELTVFGVMQIFLHHWFFEHRLLTLPAAPWSWILCFIAVDFCYYWFHRASHRIRVLWCMHVCHHQSEQYNLAVALRQPALDITSWMFYVPLCFLGFPPLMVLSCRGINLIYQFWIHTRFVRRMGPLEWIMNTPSHHRVHHGINPQYIDKNYAGVFIVWDRLFGSFIAEGEKVQYGITKPIQSFNPFYCNLYPFWEMTKLFLGQKGIKNRFFAIFRGPEWENQA